MNKRKTVVAGAALLTLASGLAGAGQFAASTEARQIATGNGTFMIEGEGDSDDGVGCVTFDIEQRRGRVRGTMVLGAEHHHGAMYPDVTAKIDEIEIASFGPNTVEFEGRGKLHLDPVYIAARAYDGDSDSRPDSFWVRITDRTGEVLFEAEGDLYIGDVSIGD